MIGTFWNLCRACPSMPVDKLHSEYRSTYKWHEYTGPRQEVVRHPPQPVSGNKEEEETKYIDNTSAMQGVIEPAMPRRKKNPSLAYRTNEFISTKSEKDNYHTSTSLDRARCAGRDIADGSCRRSKSEGPPDQASPYHQRVLRSDSDPSAQQLVITNFPMENCRTNGLKNAINRISTEYRLQFAWPRGNKWKEEDSSNSSLPRKSLSMGAIKPQSGVAPVHKKQRALNQEGNSEMEPLVAATDGELNGEEKIIEESFSKEDNHLMSVKKSAIISEYTKKYRPFSHYDRREGKLKTQKEENLLPETWFSEVIELRKKAGQYKHRGWGTELVPEHIAELYSKQVGLWEQVSRRSSLSALSLASSTHRSISKEEKEKENNKKSSPTKSSWSQKHKVDADIKYMVPHRSRLDTFVRHHLERTTGVGEEGILHSPTREKLEPVIPRRKDTVSDVNTSPKKTTFSGRSQSAGSPKKMPSRSQHKTPPPEKRQRPTTLQTAPTRTKSRTGSVKAKNRGPHKDKSNKESKPKEDIEAVVAPEPVVKSPPEPTRVKSPEQIVMRSPEPVNWTVPLDTGKTFTVTQNVVHGDLHWRAHSEGKARSESSSRPPPPPPSQSAPPVLSDPKKDGDKVEGMRCLDDPSFSFESEGTTGGDVLQKAHSRFDQFWGASQETQDKQQSTPASQF